MKPYETLDISGDAGLKIRGKTLKELFKNAAQGMFELITDTFKIKATEKKEIIIISENYESLFINWLNELIFLFDTYGFIGKSFSISIHGNTLKATVLGGTFNTKINESRLLIKAATYHKLLLKKSGSKWAATVIFDV